MLPEYTNRTSNLVRTSVRHAHKRAEGDCASSLSTMNDIAPPGSEQVAAAARGRACSEQAGSRPAHSPAELRQLWNAYLIDSARYGDSDDVVEALQNSADVNAVDSAGRTALHMAAANGHSAIVQRLLDAGACLRLCIVQPHFLLPDMVVLLLGG